MSTPSVDINQKTNNAPIHNFSLDVFKKSMNGMVAKNDSSYRGDWYERRYKLRSKIYTKDDIEDIIQSGSVDAKMSLSRTFFYRDGLYKQILVYYGTLLKNFGILIPNPNVNKKLSEKYISKVYYNAMDYVESMNLPTLLAEITMKVLVDGCYYGVVQSGPKEDFSILNLPFRFCRSFYKNEKGEDIVEINLAYFDSFVDKDIKEKIIKVYPKDIISAYNQWKKGKRGKWYPISTDVSVYFQLVEPIPFFLNVIPATLDYADAVKVEQERDSEEIKKIIVQKIPHNATNNELLFEPTEAEVMHEGVVGMMKNNKNVSVLTTYADVTDIQSKTSSDTVSNNLDKMRNNIFYEAGTSPQIFSATGNLAVATALQNDLSMMMLLGNQYGNFVTKILNQLFENANISFKYEILPISYYNEKEYIESSFKLASSGYSFLLPSIAMGLNQRDLGDVKQLENNVLKLHELLIPLSSAYTQSGTGQVGAPAKNPEDKSPKTIQNEESLDKQGTTTTTEGGSE